MYVPQVGRICLFVTPPTIAGLLASCSFVVCLLWVDGVGFLSFLSDFFKHLGAIHMFVHEHVAVSQCLGHVYVVKTCYIFSFT